MSHSPEFVSLGGRFALPAGLRCVRCDHPLAYSEEVLACERCDTIYELLERYPFPQECPACGGPSAWMGGVLVCSPVSDPSYCSRGFVPALPAPLRLCTHCGRELPWTNRAYLCYPCALRAYVDLRPTATRILALDDPTDAEWREIVGFGEADSLWATAGVVAAHHGYHSEFFVVGVGSATLRVGQLVGVIPPWSRDGGGMGTVWLVRIHCPSGMTYEVAFPAAWAGDENAALDDGRRVAPLPERVVSSGGVASGTVKQELRVARAIINALPRDPGGAPAIDPTEDRDSILAAIREVRAEGLFPSQERVGQVLYANTKDPRDSLKQRLRRLRIRSGTTWKDLLQADA